MTVDATTLTILQNDPSLKLSEACVSQGGRCGTVTLQCQILDILAKKLGVTFTSLPESSTRRGTSFQLDLEDSLERFTDTQLDSISRLRLQLPEGFEHDDYDAESGEIILHGSVDRCGICAPTDRISFEIDKALNAWIKYPQMLLLDQWGKAEEHKPHPLEVKVSL